MCVCVCVCVCVRARAGSRLQDDAAENPLVAAELGLPPHLELYWKNKLMVMGFGLPCLPCDYTALYQPRLHAGAMHFLRSTLGLAKN